MTLPVFPILEGLAWDSTKRPDFKTQTFESISGNESRVKLRRYPKYSFKFTTEALSEQIGDAQLEELMGFMMKVAGSAGAFLYTDPSDFHQDGTYEIVGSGGSDIQLVRPYGGFVEPVQNLNGLPQIFVDGVEILEPDFVISPIGVVSLPTPLTDEHVLTWIGDYYYRCRFLQDGYDFTAIYQDMYECQDIDFIGSVRNVV